MTDEEIICGFMEPRFFNGCRFWRIPDPFNPLCEKPVDLTLDRLHEVEARLSDEQRIPYLKLLVPESLSGWSELWDAAHTTAAQKIKALATVLRAKGAPNA